MKLIREDEPEAQELRRKLGEFYATFRDYNAFRAENHVDHFWPLIADEIRARSAAGARLRVLEFGAGRSGFSGYLCGLGLRERITLTSHDITSLNADWLGEASEVVAIGPVGAVTGEFDLVFSTFVLEHMTDPRAGLAHLWSLVAPRGALLLMAPRYDLPFYLPPSCDHLPGGQRLGLVCRLSAKRLAALAAGRPAFALLDDPSMFHLPWTQDRDAVHLASLLDLRAFFRRAGGSVTGLRSRWNGGLRDWKDWIVKRWLQICVRIERS